MVAREHAAARRVFTYRELAAIAPGESDEPLVGVERATVLVREGLAGRLARARGVIAASGLELVVLEGYRAPEVQRRAFDERRRELRAEHPHLGDDELIELVHGFVAVPEVAGHPCGGAVDVTLADGEGELDLGTPLDFSRPERIGTFADGLSDAQRRRRLLLHDAMVEAGFAPFYGEWWHFSYGDREWAAFYGRPAAIYGPVA